MNMPEQPTAQPTHQVGRENEKSRKYNAAKKLNMFIETGLHDVFHWWDPLKHRHMNNNLFDQMNREGNFIQKLSLSLKILEHIRLIKVKYDE
jgi:hypothetical protein